MSRLLGPSVRPFSDPLAPTRPETDSRTENVQRVRDFWELASCGTEAGRAEPHTKAWYDEIERARYSVEPFIRPFAKFDRYAGREVLEIGVGAGTDFVQWLRGGAIAHGIDLTETAIENTRRRCQLEGLTPASLRRGDAGALPFESDRFACVYSWGVLHHAIDTGRCLREAMRVLQPGGVLKVMLYNRRSLFARYIWLRHGLPKGKSQAWALAHYVESEGTTAYTPAFVERMLTASPVAHMDVHFWDPLVRPGARFRHVRQLVSAAVPSMRWFMGLEIRKEATL